jgi:hypothetical protein
VELLSHEFIAEHVEGVEAVGFAAAGEARGFIWRSSRKLRVKKLLQFPSPLLAEGSRRELTLLISDCEYYRPNQVCEFPVPLQ